MTGIKVDYINKKIILTKAYVKAMENLSSEEFNTFCALTERFPKFEVLGRTHRRPNKPNKNKNLTYEKMERYIRVFDNADELLTDFYVALEQSKVQPSPYHFVRDWFVRQFPNYKEIPTRENGMLIADPIGYKAVA